LIYTFKKIKYILLNQLIKFILIHKKAQSFEGPGFLFSNPYEYYALKASATPLCKIFPALIFKPFASAAFSTHAFSHPLFAMAMA
jgi:hypothetical protein